MGTELLQQEHATMFAPSRILLIEDDARLAELIKAYLAKQGFIVAIEGRGDTGLERILAEQPDLVILDLMLPGMDGLTLCRKVRQEYAGPILIDKAEEPSGGYGYLFVKDAWEETASAV
ncbi:MAG: hypothetical protein ACD_75C02274G0001 [uncultured bacterium]|nr:MAG: hypothetical protein ACD_75C02274G0001 [uncultured bacterium]